MSPPVVRRVACGLIPAADDALTRAREISGHSLADTVNRALNLYALVVEAHAAGGTLLIRDRHGSTQRVQILDSDGVTG